MTAHSPPPPWYRQFWPWFLIALPASSVIAGISTVLIASHQPDGVVVDDYYKQGLAINQDLARDQRAAALQLQAQLHLDDNGALSIMLRGNQVDRLAAVHLSLLHPTKAGRDQSTLLQRAADGSFRGKLRTPEAAAWHVSIEPPDGNWRLQTRLHWPQNHSARFAATP